MTQLLGAFLRQSLSYDFLYGKAILGLVNTLTTVDFNALPESHEAMRNQAREAGEGGFLRFLEEKGMLDPIALQRVGSAMRGSGQPVDTVLLELGLLEEHKLADSLSAYLNLDRIAASEFPHELPVGCEVPQDFLRRANILPLEISEHSIELAVARPLDDASARAVGYLLDRRPVLKVAVGSELARHLSNVLMAEQGGNQVADEDVHSHDLAIGDIDRLRDVASEAPIIRLLNRLVASAVERGASDIHIEPLEDHVRIRLRIDGALQVQELLDRGVQLGLVSRVKILARLNIAEQRLPQDGRIRLAVRGRDIDLRVATSPMLHGEGVVLRILDRRDVSLDFQALGFGEDAVVRLRRSISAPNGIVLVTGPTGSGKTTTLYAGLTLLNRPESKIFTVEDPIEYHLKGINQILVRTQIGLDFASVLRSTLRQDPDIIMVGEIRDSETAKIAVQASLTGHLVLSTLHTNSAASSITRLRDIGIDSFLLASTLRAIVAQRLVRRLCEHCKRPGRLPGSVISRISPGPASAEDAACFESAGCGKCHGTGYSGRTVIHEILEIDEAIKKAILADRPESEIEASARQSGMSTLFECGTAKVQSGVTSLDEILRIVTAPAT